jgi:uridine kinase
MVEYSKLSILRLIDKEGVRKVKKPTRPFVIAIAAVSGGGKTTITTELSNKLLNNKKLHFDDYDFEGPKDIIDWVNRGSNYEEWDLKPLINDLEKLVNEPLDYILLDYLFAYMNSEFGRFIDFTIFVDTPLDIALARRIQRDHKHSTVATVLDEMDVYLRRGRSGYLESLRSIKPNSDLVINGTHTIDEIVNEIIKRITNIGE